MQLVKCHREGGAPPKYVCEIIAMIAPAARITGVYKKKPQQNKKKNQKPKSATKGITKIITTTATRRIKSGE